MPQLAKVIEESDLRTGGGHGSAYDGATYLAIIREANKGVGGVVILAPDEKRRTEKRRLSVAAAQAGHTLRWRKSAEPGTLRFMLDGAGARKRGRPRIVDTERELMAV